MALLDRSPEPESGYFRSFGPSSFARDGGRGRVQVQDFNDVRKSFGQGRVGLNVFSSVPIEWLAPLFWPIASRQRENYKKNVGLSDRSMGEVDLEKQFDSFR